MRKFLADTFALIIFSTAFGFVAEVLIAEMTLAQSALARLTAVPVVLLTARPYGIYRDWMFRVTGAAYGGPIARGLTDVFAFVTFQLPIYVGILASAGATLHQILAASGSATFIMAISGRPYGLFLEFCRRMFGAASGSPK